MKSAMEHPGAKYDRMQKRWIVADGVGMAVARESTSTPPAVDRNVKRKHCALDFDTLDCPICLESLFPPVYQCANGHTACASCCKLLEKRSCPSCSLPIGTNRCIAVEKIIESLRVKCKNADRGCREMLPYSSKRDDHDAICKFRPYHCPVAGCNHEGLKSGLIQHFSFVHHAVEVNDERKNMSNFGITFQTKESAFDKSFSQYAVFDYENRDDPQDSSLFLVHLQFNERYSRYSLSCSSFGACKSLMSYHLLVTLDRSGGFREDHSSEGPIFDNQKDPSFLSKCAWQGECLLVPKLHPPQLKNGFLTMRLSLWEDRKDCESEELL